MSRWANRFILASIIQGFLITLLTAYFVLGQATGYLVPAFSRVIAAGGAGMWFVVGYFSYLVVGVIGVAVSALFYYHIEDIIGKKYNGIGNILAWIHLIFMNIGVIGATWPMIWGGYAAGGAMLPPEVGGLGWDAMKVHEHILGSLPIPITIFIIILAAGVLLGGLGYVITWFKK
jgi:heme/copper-type cytochrome/quinol oxidase subunit 1